MKQHQYRVTLEYIADPDGNRQQKDPLVFEAKCHDEILGIVDLARKRELLDVPSTTALIVGQKLFGEVVLEYRKDPLFAEFWPHFLAFMQSFKNKVKS